jgi:hypothetical protein
VAQLGETKHLANNGFSPTRSRARRTSGCFDTVAFVAIEMLYVSDNRERTSWAPSMQLTSGQSAIGRSAGPASDINVSPQSKMTNRSFAFILESGEV